ncbi:hypothetical protein, partial [Paraburkholderia sp.]|uniref:hypothetical protein n=1 Tax=Paraburkholderia sp. TaxID=1926495 RepID=UPI002399F4E8
SMSTSSLSLAPKCLLAPSLTALRISVFPESLVERAYFGLHNGRRDCEAINVDTYIAFQTIDAHIRFDDDSPERLDEIELCEITRLLEGNDAPARIAHVDRLRRLADDALRRRFFDCGLRFEGDFLVHVGLAN